jgi:hypothetical protein
MDSNIQAALLEYGISLTDATAKADKGFSVQKTAVQSYSSRHRGNWFVPEYNFSDIQIAQDTESLLAKSIEKKGTKFLLAGWDFVGQNPDTVLYIKQRIQQLEFASQIPFKILLQQTAFDLSRYNNHMWIFKRDENNSGGKPYLRGGKTIKPIAAVFPIAFETLQFQVKDSGVLDKVRQIVPGTSKYPEWSARDVVHFYMNRRPGFSVGSPTLFPVLEDIALLRRIEENVEELIESNLFPLFHYKVGTVEAPEKVNPRTGLREAEEVAQTLQYMPSSGVYVTSWRHSVEAIGSEDKALRIDYYLEYFKQRVFGGLGMSAVDFGEGDSSNRSTSQVISKALTESVEGLQEVMKTFIDYYLIIPLLLESNSSIENILAPENIVEIKFNKIDSQEKVLLENAASQLFLNNAITHEEFRKRIGEVPLKEENQETLFFNFVQAKQAEIQGEIDKKVAAAKPGAAASTQSRNQHGTSTKKASKVKDEKLQKMWDSLCMSYDKENENDILIWSKTFADRLYFVMKTSFIDGYMINSNYWTSTYSNPLEKDYLELSNLLVLISDSFITGLLGNLKTKMITLDSTVSKQTVFELSDWRLEEIDRLLLYTNELGKQASNGPITYQNPLKDLNV